MPTVAVSKLHGTQNDFIILDERERRLKSYPKIAKQWCARHTGIGADGLLVLSPSKVADARMRIFNADGTEAEMCGNGARCAARFLQERGSANDLLFETVAGPIEATVIARQPEYVVRLKMGIPKVGRRRLAEAEYSFVSLGNPHVVLFATDLNDIDLDAQAAKYNAAIAGGANVHVTVKRGRSHVQVRHWERGVGRTMACGTGAVAAAAAAMERGYVVTPVEVDVPGGRLRVEWDGESEASLEGPAVHVFDTEMELPASAFVARQ